MGRVAVRIRAPFGELLVEGESAEELLELLRGMPPQFMGEVESLISAKLAPPIKLKLQGIVEYTTEGPILVTGKNVTHYEAIGIILYASEGKTCAPSKISRLLEASGIKSMVPARLNEMAKKGWVYKPDPAKGEWKLTVQGKKWIEETVIPKLQGE